MAEILEQVRTSIVYLFSVCCICRHTIFNYKVLYNVLQNIYQIINVNFFLKFTLVASGFPS